jgi:hypothetical protein
MERLVQMLERVFDVTRETVERGQAIDDEISLRRLLEELFNVLAGGDVVADVHKRHSVVVVLFHAFELLAGRALEVLVAYAEMNGSPVRELPAGAREYLLEQRFRLLKLVFLQGTQPGFIVLQGLGDARVVRDG